MLMPESRLAPSPGVAVATWAVGSCQAGIFHPDTSMNKSLAMDYKHIRELRCQRKYQEEHCYLAWHSGLAPFLLVGFRQLGPKSRRDALKSEYSRVGSA